MEVIYDYINNEFYIKEKIDNQTFKMSFQIVEENPDSLYINIALVIYNKRKHSGVHARAGAGNLKSRHCSDARRRDKYPRRFCRGRLYRQTVSACKGGGRG